MLGNILSRLTREESHSPIDAQKHYDAGVGLATRGLYPNALVEFKLALRADPKFAEAQVELGSTYHKVGQLDKAIKSYLTALRIRPNFVVAYINLGATYDKCGDFVKALKVYAKAIVMAPQDAELRNNLGLAYFNIGSYIEAIKAFRQALVIEPDNARAHYCLGLVYLDLNDTEMALAQQSELKLRNEKELAFQLLDKIQREGRQVPTQAASSNAPAR